MLLEYDRKGTGVKVTREKCSREEGTIEKQNLVGEDGFKEGADLEIRQGDLFKGRKGSQAWKGQSANAQAKIEY